MSDMNHWGDDADLGRRVRDIADRRSVAPAPKVPEPERSALHRFVDWANNPHGVKMSPVSLVLLVSFVVFALDLIEGALR